MERTDVVIISAGMAGVACVRRSADADVASTNLHKGDGIGGRMTTRRETRYAGELHFDHVAQQVTARDPGFAQALRALA